MPDVPIRTTKLAVEYLPIRSLIPDPKNARLHSAKQIKQLERAIKSFGFNAPILIDKSNHIVAGHGRLEACRNLGISEVPVIRLEHLTEAQARAFAIADNRLAEHATWDDQLLGEIFSELVTLDLDFSIEDVGFTMGEIDLRIDAFKTPPEVAPEPNEQEIPTSPVSQVGDLWRLGAHRIFCGNAPEAASFDMLMGGDKAHMVFADPPYNVRIDGHATGNGKTRHREFAMASGEMSEHEFEAFLQQSMQLQAQNCVNGAILFQCMDWRHAETMLVAGRKTGLALKNLCVWTKDNGGMGTFYRSQHELIFVFKHGDAPNRNNFELGQHGRYRTNVWKYPGANTLSRNEGGENLLSLHPTCKSITLVSDAILDVSARGDIVLDTFLGSGTTLLAAERVGRVCCGMELDPGYVDTAIRRWQKMTGQKALDASGFAFDDRAEKLDGGAHVA